MSDAAIAERLGALAHPARLAIVRMLVRAGPNGLPAGRLGAPLGIAANALTFHLQKLSRADLVTSQRQGQFIIYRAVFPNLLDLSRQITGACCAESAEKCGPDCPTEDRQPAGLAFPALPATGDAND
ncbi:metalloregulator ArsR/SmtB family transcription factor [Rhodobacteraceae bacterium 2CG4]|uniref:Metalloregulator ArsR/SmtB family transcription factor n=1 Tax=Halovulum marinum TaxID=2662447 RepID=A0A6L5Z3Y9_9RHOB|nr:metalloregulator ArsR/SmtB family transcription factor [Halovulum marinum]MSU91256.1 metalloregulator ArsR/SmtB family transcription factor [Halovulum marinum]